MSIRFRLFLSVSCGCLLALAARAQTTQVDTSTTTLPTEVESRSYTTEDGRQVTETTTISKVRQEIATKHTGTYKAAIFISNRAGAAFDEKMMELEDLVTARITDKGMQVLSREAIADAMRSFDPAVASAPRPADSLDAKLTEQSSVLRLAQGLGADYLLIASIASVGAKERALNAYGVNTVTKETTMRVTYKILDGNTGGSLTADAIKVTAGTRQSENVAETNDDIFNDLLDQASVQLADSLGNRIAQRRIAPVSAAGALVNFTINVEAADLFVPDVRIDDDHTIRIGESKLRVSPLQVTVEIDGVAVGTAPGTLQLRPGFSKIRLSRDGYRSWERTINAVNGQSLTVAMEMTDATIARWKDATAFMNDLKNGAKLTDAQVKVLEGRAQMLRQSGFKVDTTDAPQIRVTNNSIFGAD
ncbi:MAG: PEGA domain-containing protein [Opitutaceae bacterium]|nr:PEGA domain-containing protein [Opitutaceae bacterium]